MPKKKSKKKKKKKNSKEEEQIFFVADLSSSHLRWQAKCSASPNHLHKKKQIFLVCHVVNIFLYGRISTWVVCTDVDCVRSVLATSVNCLPVENL